MRAFLPQATFSWLLDFRHFRAGQVGRRQAAADWQSGSKPRAEGITGEAAGAAGGALVGGGIGAGAGYAIGSGTGTGGGGQGLTPAARKKLGNLADRAGERVRDVIRSRSGSAATVNQAGPWVDKTLAETAQAAANGDPTAEAAIKIVK